MKSAAPLSSYLSPLDLQRWADFFLKCEPAPVRERRLRFLGNYFLWKLCEGLKTEKVLPENFCNAGG